MKISAKELLKLNHPNIIDIRDTNSYNKEHLKGAINIEMNKLILNPQNILNKQTTYYIYCDSGLASQTVCSILSKSGYDVVDVVGGYLEIKKIV